MGYDYAMYLLSGPERETLRPLWSTDDVTDQPVRRSRILVVDDQKLIADTLAEILNEAGFDAIPAYDGTQALEAASRFHPHWLISDVLMPRMHGVALAIAVREQYPATTVLLFSGQAGISEILEEARQQGHEFELIGKPIHPLNLIKRLQQQ
jgi:DNA-binding NtrC family response regulator